MRYQVYNDDAGEWEDATSQTRQVEQTYWSVPVDDPAATPVNEQSFSRSTFMSHPVVITGTCTHPALLSVVDDTCYIMPLKGTTS